MSSTKKFNRKLYEEADAKAKKAMKPWLTKQGYHDIDFTETKGVDCSCMKEDAPAYFELEIKYSWRGNPYPYHDLRIPYRKKKYIDTWVKNGSNGTLTFVVFNNDCTWGAFIDGDVVKNSEVLTMDTRFTKDEKFFHIDVEDIQQIDMGSTDISEAFMNTKYPS